EFYYDKLNQDIEQLSTILGHIEQRDDNIYRVVLGAEPIEKSVRDAGIGGADRYADIRNKNINHTDLIIALHEKVDKVRRKRSEERRVGKEAEHATERKRRKREAR